MKDRYHWRRYKTRDIVTFSLSVSTTTGTRTYRPRHYDSSHPVLTYACRDLLMEECVRMMQQSLRASPSVKKRAKSVYSQRNLGTIKDRKKEKQQVKEVSNGETILRILRMRYASSYAIVNYSAHVKLQPWNFRLHCSATLGDEQFAGRTGSTITRRPKAQIAKATTAS